MSKAVRGIGRGVSRVVRGAGRAVSRLTGSKTLGNITRVLATAAIVYFGGAAIMGGIGGMGAGGAGFFSGAGTGIANAWTGLKAAGSAAMSGNFFGEGGVTANLGAGIQGNTLAAPGSVPPVTPPVTGAEGAAAGAGAAGATPPPITPAANPAPPSTPWMQDPYVRFAVASGATHGLIGAVGGYAAAKTEKDRQAHEARLLAEQRAYDASVLAGSIHNLEMDGVGDSNYVPVQDGRSGPLYAEGMTPRDLALLRRGGGIINGNMPYDPQPSIYRA